MLATYGGNIIDDATKGAKSAFKTGVKVVTYPVEEILKSVVRPVNQLTSSVLKDTGDTVKKGTGAIWGIAVAGAVGLIGYLLITKQIKLPQGK